MSTDSTDSVAAPLTVADLVELLTDESIDPRAQVWLCTPGTSDPNTSYDLSVRALSVSYKGYLAPPQLAINGGPPSKA